jgi:allantoin racemase
MRILVINPNTTSSMTQKIAATARAMAAPGSEIVATQPPMGPVSIEGYYDEAFAVPGLLGEILAADSPDAVVLACFDDTGLDAARCATDVPVVGIGEAAYHFASMVANRFGVVTTLSRSVPALEHNLARYGLAARCAGVRASDVPVLDLEREGSDARDRIAAEIELSLTQDRAEAIVLGCAGMTDLARAFEQQFGVPVIDGVASAVKLAEAMVSLGLRTSRRGGYATPGRKQYDGILQPFAPK